MGKHHSKTFNHWDLDRFSNITKIPRDKVGALYQEFITASGKDAAMDKKEFRRLYKELYMSRQINVEQAGPSAPALWSEKDLDKMADRVFKAFDRKGSGKLSFEDFVNAYLLLDNSPGIVSTGVPSSDRFTYILDQNNPTPGKVSREHGEELYNHLNQLSGGSEGQFDDGKTWEHHWSKIDDGTGTVTQEKFVEYFTASDDYAPKFKPGTA